MKFPTYTLVIALLSFFFVLSLNYSCSKTPTCSDGIQNQGERGVDCGDDAGLCPACGLVPIDTTGMGDTGDTMTDTTGMTGDTMEEPVCTGAADMCANVGSDSWVAIATGVATSNIISISGTALDGSGITLDHGGTFTTGTYDLDADNTARYQSGTTVYSTANGGSGTLTFTLFDTTAVTISGDFEFTAYTAEGTDSIVITNGKFVNLEY